MSSVQPIPNISREKLLDTLHKVYPSVAVFTVVPGYQPVRSITHSPQPLIPEPLTSMYNPKYSKMTEAEFQMAIQNVKLEVNDSEAKFLEKSTKGRPVPACGMIIG